MNNVYDDEILPIGYALNTFLVIAFSPFILLAIFGVSIWDFFGGEL